jgi:hypothetical protein
MTGIRATGATNAEWPSTTSVTQKVSRGTTCNNITLSGAQANDVQSECPASTSDGNQKTPDERDP